MTTINFVKIINPLTKKLAGYICKQNLSIYISIENGGIALYLDENKLSGWPSFKAAREAAAELL